MNKYIKVCGIILLMIFSFYYTEKVAIYVQNNTPLKKAIISYKENNNIEFVNAQINGDYIIPGINGLEVNIDKSYNKMKSYNVFSENYLVYDQIKPEISISNFKNKVINQGNTLKNAVSIILSNNSYLKGYFDSNNISYDLIQNFNYCIQIKSDDCINSKQYIVEPTVILNSQNYLKEVNNISKGYIILIDDSLSQNYVSALVSFLKYNNLNILSLKDHLTENYQL